MGLILTTVMGGGIYLSLSSKEYAKEPFPLSTWSLFSNIPETKRHFFIYVSSYNGIKLEEPCSLLWCPFVKYKSWNIRKSIHPLIQKMGFAAAQNSKDLLRERKLKLEEIAFNDFISISYSIYHIRYYPIGFLKSGVYLSKNKISSFEYERNEK